MRKTYMRIIILIYSGIELTNFKWFVKKPRQKFRFYELFLPCFLAFPKSEKNYQRNSSNLWHALVNINKESIIESSITCIIACHIFEPRKENKTSYISIPKISIYLFTHFYLIRFISTQFAGFAFLKIKMQITFAKLFNVLSNAI